MIDYSHGVMHINYTSYWMDIGINQFSINFVYHSETSSAFHIYMYIYIY